MHDTTSTDSALTRWLTYLGSITHFGPFPNWHRPVPAIWKETVR